jgi:hypothetical protein
MREGGKKMKKKSLVMALAKNNNDKDGYCVTTTQVVRK